MDKSHNHVMQQRVPVSHFVLLLLCVTQYFVIDGILQQMYQNHRLVFLQLINKKMEVFLRVISSNVFTNVGSFVIFPKHPPNAAVCMLKESKTTYLNIYLIPLKKLQSLLPRGLHPMDNIFKSTLTLLQILFPNLHNTKKKKKNDMQNACETWYCQQLRKL